MVDKDIFSDAKNKFAFEEIVKQEATKYVTRSKKKKALDNIKKYGLIVAAPNIIAGISGFFSGGIEGSYKAMEQVSLSVIPYSITFQGFLDYIVSRQKLDNINTVIKHTRAGIAKSIQSVENPSSIVGQGVNIGLSSAMFYGLSLLTEKLTGVDFNQAQMAITGAGIGLLNSGILSYVGNKWKNKVLNYAAENIEDIKKSEGVALESEDLEGLVRGALKNSEKTHKIYVASSDKQYGGLSGALGFLGALDKLNDVNRDPTRLKPNVILDLKSEGWGNGPEYPKFIIEYNRSKSKTQTILDVARLINIRSNDLELEVHPIFSNASLDTMLDKPYEQLSAVYIHARKDDSEYFELHYDFNSDYDKIELTINSNKYIGLVSDLFKELHGRSLKNTDFDLELVQMSDKTRSLPIDIDSLSKEMREDIDELIKRGIDYTPYLPKSDDPILNLLPKKDLDYGFDKKNESVFEKPEQPLSDFNSLPKKVLDIFKSNKSNIQKADGYSALGIAFDGLVYSISPIEYYSEKGRKKNNNQKILHTIFSPLNSVKSLIKEDEVLPSIREIELMTQMSGITCDNICDIIRTLESKVEKLYVNPKTYSIDYTTFWQIPSNPRLLFNKLCDVDLRDGNGTNISIHLKPTKNSYKTIREEYFLTGENLKNKAEEVKLQKEADITFEGIISRFAKSRYEKELETKTYDIVASCPDIPFYVVMYNAKDITPFMHNRSINISTKDKFFTEMPVYPKEGIYRVTRYLSLIKDSIDEINLR